MNKFNSSEISKNTLFTPGTELFKLSVIKSSNTTLNCHLIYDENGSLKPISTYQHLEGTAESMFCDDFVDLKKSMENGGSDQAFISGHLHENGERIQKTQINTDGPPHDPSEDNYFGGESDLVKYMPNEPAIVCFVFNEAGETPSSGRRKLIAVYPQIRDATHIVIQFPSGELRLLYLAENGADIQRFSNSFIARSWISGLNRVEPSGEVGYVMHPMVKPRAFSPGYVFYQAPVVGSPENLPTIEFHAGGLLNTEEFGGVRAFECCGMAEAIVQAMKPYPWLYESAVRDNFVEQFMYNADY